MNDADVLKQAINQLLEKATVSQMEAIHQFIHYFLG